MAPTKMASLSSWLSTGAKGKYTFTTKSGPITVKEEGRLTHLQGKASRARCTYSQREFDLHRLCLKPSEGKTGLVSLSDLEALNQEAELATEAGRHPNVLHCHATLTENLRGSHCRLLLNEPCAGDLPAHVLRVGGKKGILLPDEVLNIGEQLALGLGHLSSLSILHGGPRPGGVLKGKDGQWKLADFSQSTKLPANLEEWKPLAVGKSKEVRTTVVPPEVRQQAGGGGVTAALDVWFLGHLLAGLLLGGVEGHGTAGDVTWPLAVGPKVLEEQPSVAKVWLLLHWPLAEAPENRPHANVLALLCSALKETAPRAVFQGIPRPVQKSSCRAVELAARQLAVEQAAAEAACDFEHARILGQAVSMPLAKLRKEVLDTSRMDQLCENCGVRPWEEDLEEDTMQKKEVRNDGSQDDGSSTDVSQDSMESPRTTTRVYQQDTGSPLSFEAAMGMGKITSPSSPGGADNSTDACSMSSGRSQSSSSPLGSPRSVNTGDMKHGSGDPSLQANFWDGNPFAFDSPFGDRQASALQAPASTPGNLMDLGLPDLIDL